MFRPVRSVALALPFITLLLATDPVRDFSGKWILDVRSSKSQQQETTLNCAQQESLLNCSATRADGTSVNWSYDLNGGDTRYSFGDEKRSSKVKWEGSALIVNTIISGPRDSSTVDRWTLSRDLNTLTIGREIVQNGSDNEETLVYRREGTAPAGFTNNPNPSAQPPVLQPPPPPPGPADLVVHAGTRIPLSLRNAIDTKHSHEGDRVYFTTIYPVVIDNKVVIPKGSYVNGTLTTSKPAGAVGKKGELYIRFDSLTLPNGVTRDFRSRLASKDSGRGKVDPNEGTITGERDNSNTARTTAETTGIGAGVGGIAGAAAGHPLTGLGVGAAAGAAVGLATMMNKHRPDVVLPRGTVVEMLLDRDLAYQPSELGR
jgi:type IV secretion system protein VirB10